MPVRSLAFAATAALLVAAAASSASAEVKLVQSTPAANAAAASPKSITLTFSEKLKPGATLQLSMPEHGMKVGAKTSVSADGKTLTATPQSPLMAGAYKVAWTAAGADGKKMTGQVAFKVN